MSNILYMLQPRMVWSYYVADGHILLFFLAILYNMDILQLLMDKDCDTYHNMFYILNDL